MPLPQHKGKDTTRFSFMYVHQHLFLDTKVLHLHIFILYSLFPKKQLRSSKVHYNLYIYS